MEITEIRKLLREQNQRIGILENENQLLKKEVLELKHTVAKMSDNISHYEEKIIDLETSDVKPNARRLLLPITDSPSTTPVPVDPVAFYAYMSANEASPSAHFTLKFDVVKTNLGNAYSKHSGTFVAPVSGAYVFTYTIYAQTRGAIFLNLFVNDAVFGGSISDTQETGDWDSETSTVVVSLNKGDDVNIRTTQASSTILSYHEAKTTFAGWKISNA
ncbi:complement C1q tumor necrosis factor-related protein 3-like [Saccostrea echinata]|uniref:complement C1q tumor necrosis factor-related protein 3-like n=1 Tax=Saccostrea echinata TaxID=191078 RepID=UPI002A833F31|nr:complement C1q tumor necrosis factor-related protein 3-like [Saccostrea echinata]